MRNEISEIIKRPNFLEDLHWSVLTVLHDTLIQIDENTRFGRNHALKRIPAPGKAEGHYTSVLDQTVEGETRRLLLAFLSRRCQVPLDLVDFFGEESLGGDKVNLSGNGKLTILADMIDGTDLLFRDLSNWCSALTVFLPQQEKILSSYVGMIFGDYLNIYFARMLQDGSSIIGVERWPVVEKNGRRIVSGKAELRTLVPQDYKIYSDFPLDGASICFYGQKLGRLMPGEGGRRFFSDRELLKAKDMRVYNLGGNPMMVRLAEGRVSAVFETEGQHPHDVVPGAFICQMANCIVTDLQGKKLDLVKSLMEPNSDEKKMTYLISCNSTLHEQLLPYLERNNVA